MRGKRLPCAILCAASLLAPADQRNQWLDEWRSELWYIDRRGATRFCLGAFRDVLWLRRNNLNPTGAWVNLESPASCLGFLAALAVALILVTACMLALRPSAPSHLRPGGLPAAMLILSCGLMPAIRVAMGRNAARPRPVPWKGRLRLAIFLGLKIILVQPVIACGFVTGLIIGPVAPIFSQLGSSAVWVLVFRWVFMDQQRRCPECLRLTSDPIRIGTPSQTFLAWYGAESTCPRGHGMLHTSESSGSYCAHPQWLRLGDSWSGLFAQAAKGRRP